MGEDVEPGELGRDGLGGSGLMTLEGLGVGTASPGGALPVTLAPITVTLAAPYDALPAPGTSNANAATGH
jgi:hypothetical protein